MRGWIRTNREHSMAMCPVSVRIPRTEMRLLRQMSTPRQPMAMHIRAAISIYLEQELPPKLEDASSNERAGSNERSDSPKPSLEKGSSPTTSSPSTSQEPSTPSS